MWSLRDWYHHISVVDVGLVNVLFLLCYLSRLVCGGQLTFTADNSEQETWAVDSRIRRRSHSSDDTASSLPPHPQVMPVTCPLLLHYRLC